MPVSAALVAGTAFGIAGSMAAIAGATTLALVFSLAGYGLSAYAKAKLASRNEKNGDTVSGPQEPLPVVYGTRRVGGRVVDVRINESADSDRHILDYVLAFAVGSEDGSGIEDVTKVWLDDKLAIDNPDIGDHSSAGDLYHDLSDATVAGDAGSITGVQDTFKNDIYFFDEDHSHIHYNIMRGEDAQEEITWLNHHYPNIWNDESDLSGIAYIHLSLFKVDEGVWSGIPDVRLEVKGNRVLDTRDSTTKFTNNPILCARDYLTSQKYGIGIDSSKVDDTTVSSEANFCEDTAPAEVTTSKRYACNAIVETSGDLRGNISEILTACRGELLYDKGQFRFNIPRSQTAESYVIDEDDIISEYTWRRKGVRDTPNIIKTSYIDPEQNWSVRDKQFPELGDTNKALSDEDNSFRNVRNIDLPHTTSREMAFRIALVLFQEAREDVTVSFQGSPELLRFTVGDVVKHSHEGPGWDEKKFWVSSMGLNPDGTVTIGLREYSGIAYDLSNQTTDVPVPGTDLPDPDDINPPTNLVATSGSGTALTLPGGEKVPRVLLSWDDPEPKVFLDHYEIQQKLSSESADSWETINTTPVGQTSYTTAPLADGETYDFRVRSISTSAARSDWATASDHTVSVTGAQRPIIQVDHFEVDNDSDGVIDTGKMEATIHEPGGDDVDVKFWTKQGRKSSWGNPTRDLTDQPDGVTLEETVALPPKVNAFIKVEATSTDSGLSNTEILTFDRDLIAEIMSLNVTVNDGGEVRVKVSVDFDGADGIVYLERADGTDPTADTPQGDGTDDASIDLDPNDNNPNNHQGSHTFSSVVSKGDVVQIAARAESEDGRLAPTDYVIRKEDKRPGTGSSPDKEPILSVTLQGEDPNLQEFLIAAETGEDGGIAADLEYKWKAEWSPIESDRTFDHDGDGNDDWISFTSDTSVRGEVTDTLQVEKPDKPSPALLVVIVRDTSVGSAGNHPTAESYSTARPKAADSSGSATTVIPTTNAPSGTDFEGEPDGTIIAVY